MANQKIFSGIQPSGTIHIGNYLGAIKNWVDLQYQYESTFCIVDYHAITLPYDPKQLPERVIDLAATLLAAGIDPERSTLFVQSMVPEHTELAWLLTCITSLGQLERMTQFKEKSARQERGSVSAGLMCYPILQAADILIHRATIVPVGEDQLQHLEITRDIARRFNHLFGQYFDEPEAYITKGARVMSLNDPTSKMSKSLPNGMIALSEEPDTIRQIVRRAVTDTGDQPPGELSPGVRNLFTLLEAFASEDVVQSFKDDLSEGKLRYAPLKDALADAIIQALSPIRERRNELLADRTTLTDILAEGAARARSVAQQTMSDVRERMGFPAIDY